MRSKTGLMPNGVLSINPPEDHFDEDDCLVFYPQNQQEYDTIIENLEKFQLKPIKAKNPYWDENGITILDPDGFHIIISLLKITNI